MYESYETRAVNGAGTIGVCYARSKDLRYRSIAMRYWAIDRSTAQQSIDDFFTDTI